ncbi:MAG: protein-L-isoaspartate(D-aspartate) O-methyltransferase [Alphaproteobacteria bacterium]
MQIGDEHFAALRREMIEIIAVHTVLAGDQTGRRVLGDRVIEAMGRVPRHEFVPVELRAFAYNDHPLPIGYDKTISQPFMVALMTDLLDIREGESVLEVGTGLGYQAAVLAEIAARVYSIEIIEELAEEAGRRLKTLGYANVEIRLGDGSRGWPEFAPFDKVIVTAAPELIPPLLLAQLASGGRMIIPAGIADDQKLMLVEKGADDKIRTRELLPVRFTPLVTSH